MRLDPITYFETYLNLSLNLGVTNLEIFIVLPSLRMTPTHLSLTSGLTELVTGHLLNHSLCKNGKRLVWDAYCAEL
jgi:hypothetical protein